MRVSLPLAKSSVVRNIHGGPILTTGYAVRDYARSRGVGLDRLSRIRRSRPDTAGMRPRLIAAFLLCLPGSVVAAETRPVSGEVRSAVDAKTVAGARLSAAGASAVTAKDGRFAIEVPLEAATLTVVASGFRAVDVAIGPGAIASLAIVLEPDLRYGESVDVVGVSPGELEAGQTPVAPGRVLSVAGGVDNVFRSLQRLPGVVAPEELSSRLSVRGGGPDQNLTMMDGVEIHNPYRLFGLTSAFNPEVVADFELSTGGFGVRHGDRLSSLLEIRNRAGAEGGELAASASMSVTDANVVIEGRLPEKTPGTWVLSARRTYYDLVANRFVDGDLPAFADVQVRSRFDLGGGMDLTFLGLSSRESADVAFDGDPGERAALGTRTDNDLGSLSLHKVLGSRGAATTVLSRYRNEETLGFDGRLVDETRLANAPGADSNFNEVVFDRDLSVEDLSLREDITLEAGKRHVLGLGFELHRLHTRVSWDIRGDRNNQAANGSSVRGGSGLPEVLDSSLRATRGSVWLEDAARISESFTITPGLRYDYSGLGGGAIAPRLALSLGLGSATRLKLATGLYFQSPGYEKLIQGDYFVDLSSARELGLANERAIHAIVGLERELGRGMSVKLEGYWKRFDDLVIGRLETAAETASRVATYDFPTDLADSVPREARITSAPSNGGRGRAYGIDLYATRRATAKSTRLTGWVAYTLSKAASTAYGRTYPFSYDRRHSLSAVGSYRLGAKWELGFTGNLASGFPRTPVRGLRAAAVADASDGDGDGNRSELVPQRDPEGRLVYTIDLGGVDNLNRGRLPYYARLDLRLTFRPGGDRGRFTLYLEGINVLNRDNASDLEARLVFDPTSDRPKVVEEPSLSLPFLPSFGVRYRF